MTRRARTRTAVVLPVAAALVAAAGGTALAVAQARAAGTQPVGVGTFGAQASTSSTTGPTAPLVLSFAGKATAAQTFFLRNTGTLQQSAQTWTISLSDTGGGTKGSVSLRTCTGSYSGGTCSGGTESDVLLTVQEATSNSVATSITLAAGAFIAAKLTPSAARGFEATVSLSVARSQVRAATTSAS